MECCSLLKTATEARCHGKGLGSNGGKSDGVLLNSETEEPKVIECCSLLTRDGAEPKVMERCSLLKPGSQK